MSEKEKYIEMCSEMHADNDKLDEIIAFAQKPKMKFRAAKAVILVAAIIALTVTGVSAAVPEVRAGIIEAGSEFAEKIRSIATVQVDDNGDNAAVKVQMKSENVVPFVENGRVYIDLCGKTDITDSFDENLFCTFVTTDEKGNNYTYKISGINNDGSSSITEKTLFSVSYTIMTPDGILLSHNIPAFDGEASVDIESYIEYVSEKN